MEEKFFYVPSGTAGAKFVSELARLYRAYADGSALECVALKAVTVLCTTCLQKPNKESKAKDHVDFLERWLRDWL